ncbi:hypothetical protein G9A89_020204 [Geosiphon pyriformis]|nr:hypothetical protein G9A89_020204 [Geosiphon pyriformis]
MIIVMGGFSDLRVFGLACLAVLTVLISITRHCSSLEVPDVDPFEPFASLSNARTNFIDRDTIALEGINKARHMLRASFRESIGWEIRACPISAVTKHCHQYDIPNALESRTLPHESQQSPHACYASNNLREFIMGRLDDPYNILSPWFDSEFSTIPNSTPRTSETYRNEPVKSVTSITPILHPGDNSAMLLTPLRRYMEEMNQEQSTAISNLEWPCILTNEGARRSTKCPKTA